VHSYYIYPFDFGLGPVLQAEVIHHDSTSNTVEHWAAKDCSEVARLMWALSGHTCEQGLVVIVVSTCIWAQIKFLTTISIKKKKRNFKEITICHTSLKRKIWHMCLGDN